MARTTSAPEAPAELPSAAWKHSLATDLLAWFARHRRDLPWRQSSDPYRVWISEIMLQQTQVATVIPYFQRFVAAFPTVARLAAADEHDVLRLWEGLGYYRRARQLHRAAQVIVSEHGGKFPRTFDEVRNLPGIGRYTAGAIASIAYDEPAPILEANTVRLLSRLFAISDAASSAGQRRLWELAEAILPPRDCGTFNQALMELGSLVCTPKAPRCDACPVSDLCAAFQTGRQDEIPAPKARPVIEEVREAAVVISRRDKVFVRRRAPGERWAGLWDFVRFPLTSRRGSALARELAESVRNQTGLEIAAASRFTTLKHGVTRFRITLDCYTADCPRGKSRLPVGDWQWIAPADLETLPLSVTGRKLSRLIVAAEE